MPEEPVNVAVVTGASRGIGRLLAMHLARAGTSVVAVARSSRELDSLTDGAAGTQLTVMPGDVTDPAAVRGVFEVASALLGPPMTVITCAGSIDGLGSVAKVDPDRWWSAVTRDRGPVIDDAIRIVRGRRERDVHHFLDLRGALSTTRGRRAGLLGRPRSACPVERSLTVAHDDLLASCGVYSRLWDAWSAHRTS